MPIFVYKAKKGPKEAVKGEIKAASQYHAISQLNEMGLAPVTVTEKAQAKDKKQKIEKAKLTFTLKNLRLGFTRVKPSEINTFTRQLTTLVKASVPILQALSFISRQTENKTLRNIISDLQKQVKEGITLSEAMSKYPGIFNNLYLSMVKSGEKAGVLDEVLYKIAEHRDREQEIRYRIQAAMVYPSLIIITGIATIFAMLTFFLPKLIGLFENMKQALPASTKILIVISNFMSSNWYWFLIVLGIAVAIFGGVRPGSKKKFLFDVFKLHIPFMKKIVKNEGVARFARTLGLLLKNGIPVYESLELATNTLDNEVLQKHLEEVQREIVEQGATLSSSLKKIDFFPAFAVNMIAIGEESGSLDESLNEVANVYERELEQATKIMTSLLEPLLILVVGAVVGFIVFAMLLPIFNIGVMTK